MTETAWANRIIGHDQVDPKYVQVAIERWQNFTRQRGATGGI